MSRKQPNPKQPPAEQQVVLEVFRDLTTGGRVTVIYEVPGEQWFRECQVGDEMPCKVMRIVDSQERPPAEPA